jgi:hypothetical protein
MDLQTLVPLTDLALTAMLGRAPGNERAWRALIGSMSPVHPIATRSWRRACAIYGWHYTPNHPLVAEFLADVPHRLFQYRENFAHHYESALAAGNMDGLFARWCEPVLISGFCQLVRNASVVAAGIDRHTSRPAPAPPSVRAQRLRYALASGDALSDRDLRIVAGWCLDDRIFLAAEAGFAHKLPPYRAWTEQRDLPWPFPPHRYVTAPPHQQRTLLARAMGISRDLADQWWRRGRPLLKDLELFQG